MTRTLGVLYLLFTPDLCSGDPWETLEQALAGGQSAPGQGSTFWVDLPLAAPGDVAPETGPAGDPAPNETALGRLAGRTILCVSFPDSFAFTGPPRAQYRLIGNAVPPPMALCITTYVRAALIG